jgi:hypothetical protein
VAQQWATCFSGVDMKFSPKHKRVVEAMIAEGKHTVILDGIQWDVHVAAQLMGIQMPKKSKKDKYRKKHADLEQTLDTGHIEDGGDGISEE